MTLLGVLLLLSVGLAAFSNREKEYGERVYSHGRKIYTSEHNIVHIFTPFSQELKSLLPKDIYSVISRMEITETTDYVEKIFFIQGDYKDDGTLENKGLFVLKPATGEATKLLDNGTDITSVAEENKAVYFAATDGIYLYDAENNTAEKYGSVTDNIISIAQTKTGNVFYILTAEKVLYKLTDNGEKKEKVDDVKDAQQILLDIDDNLYFYDNKKRIFVKKYSEAEAPLIQFMDIPVHSNKIKLLRGCSTIDGSILVVLDDTVIPITSGGQCDDDVSFFHAILSGTAQSVETGVIHYVAFNKSIYEYNIFKIPTEFMYYSEGYGNTA